MAKIGPSYCQDCGKRTYLTEEAVQQRIRDTLLLYGHFLSAYRCPARPYGFHVRNIEKRLAKGGKDGERSKLEREITVLLGELQRAKNDHSEATVQVRRAAALDRALRKLRPTAAPVRHRHNKFQPASKRRRRRRDTARVGLPRGELVTKMLSWPNGKKHDRRGASLIDGRDDRIRRRRNRARENEAVRRLVTQDTASERRKCRCGECNLTDAQWHAAAENDELERTLPIDYDGTWTCG